MIKVFRCFLFIVVLFCLASCSQAVDDFSGDDNGDEWISLNFRAAADVVGADLSVSLSEGDEVIDSQDRKITIDDNSVIFRFDNLLVGKELVVNVEVKKDGVVLYGGNDSITVKKGENPVRIELSAVNVSLDLHALNLPLSDLEGADFYVTVNGVEKAPVRIEPGTDMVYVDIGYQEVGENLCIEGWVERMVTPPAGGTPVAEIYQLGSMNYVVQKTDSRVSLNMVPFYGCLLWKNNADNIKINVIRKKDMSNYDVSNDVMLGRGTGLLDFFVDDKSNAWCLYNDSNGNCNVAYVTIAALSSSRSQLSGVMNGITPLDGGVLSVGFNRGAGGPGLKFTLHTKDPVNGSISGKPVNNSGYSHNNDNVRAVTASGNDVYVASAVHVSEPSGPSSDRLRIIKFKYSNAGGSGELSYVAQKDFGADVTGTNSNFATDMMLVGNDLYVTVIDGGAGSSGDVSRGLLLKIDKDNLDFVDKLGFNSQLYCRNNSDAEKYFVGPRKFVGEKPGKLVIADGGCIRATDDAPLSQSDLCKRIVTVDLATFKFEKIEKLGDDMLDGCLSVDVPGGYDGQVKL